MIKFPTDYGVGELCGNQVAAYECYIAMMEMDDHLQAMSIEEHRTTMEPAENPEEVLLDDSKLDRTTKIGTSLIPRSAKRSRLFSEIIRTCLAGATRTCQG